MFMHKLVSMFGVMGLAAMLGACAVAPDGGDESSAGGDTSAAEEGDVAEAQEAITACRAPIDDMAVWIDSTRTGSHWCPGCSYVTVQVHDDTAGTTPLSWYAGIDESTWQYIPPICWMGSCTGGGWVRLGIRGDFYGLITVSREGNVSFTVGSSSSVQITPDATTCSTNASGQLVITGTGQNGHRYTVYLSKTWFS